MNILLLIFPVVLGKVVELRPSSVIICANLVKQKENELFNSAIAHGSLLFIEELTKPQMPKTDKRANQALQTVDPMSTDDHGTSLWYKELLKGGCVIDEETRDNPLLRVYRYGLINTAETLLNKNIYSVQEIVNARDSQGNTVLHLAAKVGAADLITKLAAFLGNNIVSLLTAVNKAGEKPIDIAKANTFYSVMQKLKDTYNTFSQHLMDDDDDETTATTTTTIQPTAILYVDENGEIPTRCIDKVISQHH